LQDLLVASLFRNFLLAERVMAGTGCTPCSLPRLPPTAQHPLWAAWDMAAELCLMQLPTLLSDPGAEFQPSAFFADQLTAFELWLASGSKDRAPPEQLPIVLQVGRWGNCLPLCACVCVVGGGLGWAGCSLV
jgi:regulator-associated protein of mTOR